MRSGLSCRHVDEVSKCHSRRRHCCIRSTGRLARNQIHTTISAEGKLSAQRENRRLKRQRGKSHEGWADLLQGCPRAGRSRGEGKGNDPARDCRSVGPRSRQGDRAAPDEPTKTHSGPTFTSTLSASAKAIAGCTRRL